MEKKNDLTAIATEIRKRQGRTSVAIVEIGVLLNEAAESLPHGDLMSWIEREFDFSYRTACRYRDVAAMVTKLPNWQVWAANLSKGALYDFADSSEDVRAAVRQAALNTFLGANDVCAIALDIMEADLTDVHDDAPFPIDDGSIKPETVERITVAPVINKIFKIANSGWSPCDLAQSVSEADLNFAIYFLQDIRRAQKPEIDPIKSAADRAEQRAARLLRSSQVGGRLAA